MDLLTIFAAAEASFLSASWLQRARIERQELLLGKEARSLMVPFIGNSKQTDRATRLQAFAAKQVTAICRQVVHTGAFELLVFKLIQSASRRLRREVEISRVEVIL